MTFNGNWGKSGGESRTEEYRTWRTRCGFGAVSDVDQVEYRACDGRPLVAIELCVADRRSTVCPAGIPDGLPPSDGFFEQVIAKVSDARAQGRFARSLTGALHIPLVLVVYIKGELAAGVWVKRLGSTSPWLRLTLADYESCLRHVHHV